MSTIHANSPQEALWRLETLALSAGDTSELAVRRQIHAAVDIVVQMERNDRSRVISDVARVAYDGIEESP
jgi:pilus assembly protein CpaF